MNRYQIVSERPVLDLKDGDGFVVRCKSGDSNVIVDGPVVLSEDTMWAYIFVTGTSGSLMGEPFVARVPWDQIIPLTYAVA